MKNFKLILLLFLMFLLLAFPLFYFVYKYSSPYLGMIDFFDYYKLYKDMDIKGADSPLNMRLVSSFFIYCLSKTGFIYNTVTQIDNAPFDKVVYFNAVFFNYICVTLTCVTIFFLARLHKNSFLASFLGGLLYLLGFGTIFFEIFPLTDALSVLLVAVFLFFYHKNSWLVLIPLITLILQREYVLIAFILLTLLDFIHYKNRFYLYSMLACILCFGTYIILRKFIFETPRYSHHTSVEFMLNAVSSFKFPIMAFIRQTSMTLNIFFIYLLIVAYKFVKKITFNKYEFIKITLLFVQLLMLTFLLSLGNNAGRYFYILVPLIIINILNEIKIFKLGDTASVEKVT